MQIIKYINLSRFQHILKRLIKSILLKVHSFKSRLKLFIGIFYKFRFVTNEGAIHNFKIIDYAWISIMLFDLCWKW